MLNQVGTHPLTVFLIMMAFSTLLFAGVRLLMHTLYAKVLYRWRYLATRIEKLKTSGAPLIKKYGIPGLMLFVALPVPGTGVVGGTILSWVSGLKWYTSFLAIIPAAAIENIFMTLGVTWLIHLVHL